MQLTLLTRFVLLRRRHVLPMTRRTWPSDVEDLNGILKTAVEPASRESGREGQLRGDASTSRDRETDVTDLDASLLKAIELGATKRSRWSKMV